MERKKTPVRGNRMAVVELAMMYVGVNENQVKKPGWGLEF